MLTQDRLKEVLHYDAETGVFIRRITASNIRAGNIAGAIHAIGYRRIKIDNRCYQAHRLAWLYVFGVFPKHDTDHINGVRDDNRISNLREATRAENQQNRAKHSKNTSGLPGVTWFPIYRKWLAQISINQKKKYLGLFDTPEAAHAAYVTAKAELHTFNPTVRAD